MKVAVDVKGTIEGPKQAPILTLIKLFKEAGHEVVIWSGCYSFAVDANEKHKLNLECSDKLTRWNTEQEDFFDLAIEDDRSQTYLAAKNFLFVGDIPSDEAHLMLLAKNLGSK